MSTAGVYRNRYHPFVQYFVDIWNGLATTAIGMRVTLSYLFSKPTTMRYPEERPMIPATHRGLHSYSEEECTSCRLCARACPVDCIHLEMVGRGKDAMMVRFDIDYSRCLFCNLCAEACPPKGIKLTEKYDLACGSREGCVLHLARTKTDEEVAAHKARLERAEAEARAKREAQKSP